MPIWSRCAQSPADQAIVREIRRGFHTLKGSSRMVGLKDYGEVAWTAEQALNRWVEDGTQATERLYEFIEAAHLNFGAWVEAIAAGQQPRIDKQTLMAEATALELKELASEDEELGANVVEAEAAPVDVQTASPEAPANSTRPSHTQTVSNSLRDIYLSESAQLLDTLSQEVEVWGARRGASPAAALTRTTHTLAGISRTTSQPATAALAYAFEQWLLNLTERPHDPGERALDAMRRAHQKLAALVAAFRDNLPAEEDLALIAEIEAFASAGAPATPDQSVDEIALPERDAEPTIGADERRRIVDDIDIDLLPVFLEEAETLVPVVGGSLRDWNAQPKDVSAVQALQRALHTFKGSARMVGALRLGELIHRNRVGGERSGRWAGVDSPAIRRNPS